MRNPRDLLLVADLGGSSLRVALADPAGGIRVQAHEPVALATEADPEDWVAGFTRLVGAVLRATEGGRVTTIAITAFTRTEVHLDAAGRVLRPAMTFRDRRAEAEAQEIDARLGGSGAVTPFSPLARLAWMRRHEPDRFASLALVLQPKDFLNFRLTGMAASDCASNAPLVGEGRAYLGARFAAAGIDPALFAPLRAPRAWLGRVLPGLPGALARLAGAQVAVGCMDTWAATLGMGAHAPGTAYNLSGTTEVNGLMLAGPAHAPGLLGVAWDDDLFHLGGPSNAGAQCLAWLAGILRMGVDVAAGCAATLSADAPVPLFLPYLDGERVPFWQPQLRGGFLGLDPGSDRALLVRAVMEGVAFHDRLVLERAIAGAGREPARILVAGGGASSDLWCQIKADAWRRPIERPAIAEAGLRGAIMLAGGTPPVPAHELFAPSPAAAAALELRYRRFLAAIDDQRR